MLEIPETYSIEIYGSYEKPNLANPIQDMLVIDNPGYRNFLNFNDIPTYIYLIGKHTSTNKKISAKGFTVKEL